MPYPRKYDYDLIKALWYEGLTTVEIGRVVCPDLARPHRTIGAILRGCGFDLARAKRRKYFGKAEAYAPEEIALWKRMRPTHTVQAIFDERRKVIPRLNYAAVHRHVGELPGPMVWKYTTKPQQLEMRRLYQTYGWHIRDIALRYGCADTTVRKYIGGVEAYSLPPRKRQPNYMIHAPMADIAARVLPRKAA